MRDESGKRGDAQRSDFPVTAPDVSFPAFVRREVQARAGRLIEFRRDLHQHPEPGFGEIRTAARVTERLRAAGLTVRTEIAGTGVLAQRNSRSGRTILFRADMDALPLTEETGAPYASRNPGFMHACGHDGHTAMLVEAAELLQETGALTGAAADPAGRTPRSAGGVDVAFVFQPAEEGPGGALPMIREGVLEESGTEAVFGLHLWSQLPVGKIAITAGPAMASADEFEITIQGRGGHGAFPHETVDAVVVGSYVVTALQTLVARNADPLQTAVVSVGSFQAGSNFNIIAETAVLKGTIRTFDPGLRDLLVRRLEEVSVGVARSLGATCAFRFQPHYPATVNDPRMAAFAASLAEEMVGRGNVVQDLIMMGAEDFSFFLRERPGCFIFVGAGNAERGLVHPHHSPRFDLDESALGIGCELLLRIAERYPETFPQPVARGPEK